MSHTLLFEIGTEELPPSELPAALPALEQAAVRALGEARLAFERVQVYCTPRRFALVVSGLAARQEPLRTTITGPPKKAAFDAAGKPTKAAEGFARAQGVAVDQLITIDTERGEYLAADRTEPGRDAATVLPDLLGKLVFAPPFAKQMRWGDGDVRYVRPVRWIVALLDGDVLPMTVAGVRADRITHGHRFLHPAPISLSDAGAYVASLETASVMPDVAARRDAIRRVVDRAARDVGYHAAIDAATLEIVVHLVEAPAAIVGTFAKASLDLPREVVETPIRRHQKCFPVQTADGALAPAFVAVSNMPGADPGEIRRGNERVIRARLADAEFYFREDLKVTPTDRLRLLEGMVFQERLGTLREKTDRLVALAEFLASAAPGVKRDALVRAARLAKSDLASGMVREFPELQGVIGEEYAVRAGESPAVGRAIREHYLPRSADDALPQSLVGALLSIADKLDTVVACLGVGLVPTGSQDPYALRRHAQGVVQIALARGSDVRFSLRAAIDRALELVADKLTEPADATRERALEFFRARLATILVTRGARPDVVEAVLVSGFDEPLLVVKRVDALSALMKRPDWDPLVVTFKRTINILPPGFEGKVDAARFVHDAERRLDDATRECRPAVRAALEAGDYSDALSRVAALRAVVDGFFDGVMVMDKDRAIQQNRLALLKALAELLLPVADLRKIQAAPGS
jgi:glycyl-tRNA synthetase beta chain